MFIGPHRQYHVRTTRGKMLVQNRRFLRRKVLGSLPSGGIRSEALQPTQIQSEGTEEAQPIQRRSTHQGKPVSRLLETHHGRNSILIVYDHVYVVVYPTKACWGRCRILHVDCKVCIN